jgi:Domain of unknown function (DUF4440)
MKLSVRACFVAAGLLPFALQAALIASPAFQMTVAEKTALEKTLMANEQKLNDAVLKGDAATFKSMIADDGWSVDEQGVMPAADFVRMLKPGVAKITDARLDGFKVLWVDANTAVLTYTWTGKGTFNGQAVHSPTYASTVYTRRGTRWVAMFHQETSAPQAPPAKK